MSKRGGGRSTGFAEPYGSGVLFRRPLSYLKLWKTGAYQQKSNGSSKTRAERSLLDFREKWLVSCVLVAVDILALELSFGIAYVLRSAFSGLFPVSLGIPNYAGIAIGVLFLPLFFAFAGLYPGYLLSSVERLRRRVYITVSVFGLLIAWDLLVQGGTWSRSILLATGALSLLFTPLFQAIARQTLIVLGHWGTPAILIGAGAVGQRVARVLAEDRELGVVPIGFLHEDKFGWGGSVQGIPVIGSVDLAPELADRAMLAIVSAPDFPENNLAELCAALPFPKVIVVPDLAGLQSLWVEPRDFSGVLGLEINRSLMRLSHRIMKRSLDYAVAVPALLMALPVIAFAALAIKLVSPGPVFYRQMRQGFGDREFAVLKLRTMHIDAEQRLQDCLDADSQRKNEWERFYKLENDPRVIPFIGNFLRQSSMDELPQLWNVLRGDMSVVGPRPFPAYHLLAFDSDFCTLRKSVPPGLTGLWQVQRRSEGDLVVQQELDDYYIRNWSLWLDFHILLRTVAAVTVGRGAK